MDAGGREDLKGAIERVLGGGSGVELVRRIDGEERFFAYAPIPSTGWTFVTSVPKAEAFAEFNRIIRYVVSLFLVAMLQCENDFLLKRVEELARTVAKKLRLPRSIKSDRAHTRIGPGAERDCLYGLGGWQLEGPPIGHDKLA